MPALIAVSLRLDGPRGMLCCRGRRGVKKKKIRRPSLPAICVLTRTKRRAGSRCRRPLMRAICHASLCSSGNRVASESRWACHPRSFYSLECMRKRLMDGKPHDPPVRNCRVTQVPAPPLGRPLLTMDYHGLCKSPIHQGREDSITYVLELRSIRPERTFKSS